MALKFICKRKPQHTLCWGTGATTSRTWNSTKHWWRDPFRSILSLL